MNAIKKELRLYQEIIQDLRIERHDFKNQIQTIYTMIELNKLDEVKCYLKSLYSEFNCMELDSEDDSLLSSLLIPKKEEGIKFGIEFDINNNIDLNIIAISQNKLIKIIFNLIDNSLDVLKNSSQEIKKIRVELLNNHHNINLVIQNNGPIIRKEMIKQIFIPGYSTKGEGRGFGLYIVKSLLEELGGEIMVKSNQEIGTKFICKLPKN